MSDPKTPGPQLAGAAGSAVELAKRIPFRMVMHMSLSTEHHLDYLNEPLNLACCITTKYRNGRPGKSVREFGINERKAKSYKTLAALLEDYPEIAEKAAALYPPNDQAEPRRIRRCRMKPERKEALAPVAGSATWGAYRLHDDGWYRLDPDFAKPVPPEAASVIENNFWDLAKPPNAAGSPTGADNQGGKDAN